MRLVFEFIRDNILRKMPSGCIVTKENIEFDIGGWQHKSYNKNESIRGQLRGQWCPATINILIIDDQATHENIEKFMDENDFQKNGRHSYFVFTIAISKKLIDSQMYSILNKSKFSFTRFSTPISFDEHFVFLNDFVRPIIYI